MNEEDRLMVELIYGVDMSYTSPSGYFTEVLTPLPFEFIKEYDYFTPLAEHAKFGYSITSDEFKTMLIKDLLEYKSKHG